MRARLDSAQKARNGAARLGIAQLGLAKRFEAWHGAARLGTTRQVLAMCGRV
jgi:hypothetical protein